MTADKIRLFSLILISLSLPSFASEEIPPLEIEQIDESTFLHRSYSRVDGYGLVSSNGLVVVDSGKAFIIDTPWSERDTEELVNWARNNNYELLGSISTHSHEDTSAGIKWLNEHSIPSYATKLTNYLLKAQNKAQAKYALGEEDTLLADGLLEVFYPGVGHSIDNIVVWVPKSKTLFGGCFVRSLKSKGLGYTGEAYIDQWSHSAQNTLTKYPQAEIVVPGHGEIGDLELLAHTRSLAEAATNSSNN